MFQIFSCCFHFETLSKKYNTWGNNDITKAQYFDILIPRLLLYDLKRDEKNVDYAKMSLDPVWHPFFSFKNSTVFIHYAEPQESLQNYHIEYYKVHVNELFKLKVYGFYNPDPYSEYFIPIDFFHTLDNLKNKNEKAVLYLNLKRLDGRFIEHLFSSYSDSISGFNLSIEIDNIEQLKNAVSLLNIIDEKFILVSRSTVQGENLVCNSYDTKYYRGDICGNVLLLSYVNKKEVDGYSISLQQDTRKYFSGRRVRYFNPEFDFPPSDIHWAVTITEIVKQKYKKWTKQ